MKRIFSLMAACMLVVGVAGTASAFLSQGSFVADINEGANELMVLIDDTLDNGLNPAGPVEDIFPISYFTEATSYADLKFGGFSGAVHGDQYQNYEAYVAVSGTPTLDANIFAGIANDGAGALEGAKVEPSTAGQRPSGTAGYLGTLGAGVRRAFGADATTISLAAFDEWQEGQVITLSMDIWHVLDDQWGMGGFAVQEDSGLDLTITRNADGTISTAVVPIPGALMLLGSGLLALVGIRRKNA